MMTVRNWLRFVATLFVLLVPHSAPSQSRDIHLNIEPLSCVLPDDIRIESAAQSGESVLAVWGGLLGENSDSAQNVLWSQIIRKREPIGTPTIVHSNVANPFGAVYVAVLRDRFLVVWNDNRAGEAGMYAQTVGIDGGKIGSEVRISEGRMMGIRQAWLHRVDKGEFDLIWNDPRGIYARRIDENGRGVEPERKLDSGAVIKYRSYPSFPGYVVLQQANGSAVVMNDNGESAQPIPPGRLNFPYYLSSDQSLVLVRGDTLHHYLHFSNQQPTHSLYIPQLQKTDTQFRAVVRDSSGRYGVVFAELYFGEIYCGVSHTAWIDDNWEIDTISNMRYIPGGYGGVGFMGGGIDSVIRIEQCDNSIFIHIYATYVVKLPQYPFTNNHTDEWVFINSYGEISRNQAESFYSCDDAVNVNVVRFYPVTATGVVVSTMDTAIAISAPLQHCYPDIYDSRVNIRNNNNRLLITWERGKKLNSVFLGEWINPSSDKISLYSTLSQSGDYIKQFDKNINILNRYRHNNVDVCTQENLASSYSFLEHDWFLGENANVYIGNDSKWLSCVKKTFSGKRGIPELSAQLQLVDAAYNPNNAQLLISLYSRLNASQTLAVNYQGEVLWSYNFATYQGAIVPINANEFYTLLKSSDSLLYYRSGQLVSKRPIPAAKGAFTCQRLLGERFLRLAAVDTPATQFTLDLFDINGDILHSTTITPTIPGWHPTVVEYPADNSLMLIWGSPAGVQMCHFTRELNLLRPQFQVSERADTARYPAAAFRNDTMFLVWERTTNAMRDLVGTLIKRNQISDAQLDRSPIATPLLRYTYPVPASDQLRIGVDAARVTNLQLYDVRGLRVVDIPREAITEEVTVNTRLFPPGIYLLTVGSGAQQERRSVVVMR